MNPTFSVICLENITVRFYAPRRVHKKNLMPKRLWELQSSTGVPEQDSHTCQSMQQLVQNNTETFQALQFCDESNLMNISTTSERLNSSGLSQKFSSPARSDL